MNTVKVIDFKPETGFKSTHTLTYEFDSINHIWRYELTVNYNNLKQFSNVHYSILNPQDFTKRWMDGMPLHKGYFRTVKGIA